MDSEPSSKQHVVARQLSRRFQVILVGEGALVGLVVGIVITLYRMALSAAEGALRSVTEAAQGRPLLMAAWFAVLACVLLLVGRLMVWEPYTTGSGIPQLDAEVIGRIDMPWKRVLPAKFAEGTLLAFAGLSLGREGPSVEIGGVAGKGVSRALKRGRGEERLLVTCGAAAGMSAAFHAPLTGVLFALEEIHKEFSAPVIISVMSASVVADFVMSQVLGVTPVLDVSVVREIPHSFYLLVVLFGVICGILGALHNKGMFAIQDLYGRIGKGQPYTRLVIPFALAGVIAFAWPELMCGGDAIVELLTSGETLSIMLLVALLVGKYAYTAICFGSSAPGGTLFPLVVMGALVGAIFGQGVTGVTALSSIYVNNFIALGVAGLFSGVVRAPVTAVVLVFELSGSLDALLPVCIVSIVAYVTANVLHVDAFYEHLLIGLLKDTPGEKRVRSVFGEKVLRNFHVGAGSRLEGMLIKDVTWPDRVRVLTVDRSGVELIATGDTRLMALDELLVIVDEKHAEDADMKLRIMCEPQVIETPSNEMADG